MGENVTALEKSIKSFQMTRREENMKDLWGSLSNESMPEIPSQKVEIQQIRLKDDMPCIITMRQPHRIECSRTRLKS